MKNIILLIILLFPTTILAKPIVADLSFHSVDIDYDFKGIENLMFGARNDPGKIVTILRGPAKTYIVRKKERLFGIWVNRKSVVYESGNSAYMMASSVKDLESLDNPKLLKSLGIGFDNLPLKIVRSSDSIDNAEMNEFLEAFIRSRKDAMLFKDDHSQKVTFWGETLFRTVLEFPENIEGGWYTAELYLFNGGILSSMQATPILVSKIGFEAFLTDLAKNHAIFYGILAVLIALILGCVIPFFFRR